jgi:serine/threonine-protein kinase
MGNTEPLQTLWADLGIAPDAVVPLQETLSQRTWSTLSGGPEGGRPASIDLEELPAPLAWVDGGQPADDVQLLEEIGRGGMGIVHLARQHSLGREVAVKRLNEESSKQASSALINEARITGGLEHPNIPPVHLLCQDGGKPVLVMKRIEGEPWSDLMKDPAHPAWHRTRWANDDAMVRNVSVAELVCDALAYAHSRGIIHRDIKPANVMMGAFGEVYLLDWGMAIKVEELKSGKHAVVGTPAYMSPEMVDGQGDERSDVYLVGAVLHQAMTGKTLHTGKTLYQCLASIYAAAPVAYGPEVPSELAAILRKACAPKLAERYQTVTELQRALRNWRQHRLASVLIAESEQRVEEAERAEAEDAGRLLTEARFGFLQALRDWNSPVAREGLQACSFALAEWELDRGNLVAARRYLQDLGTVPEPLQGKVSALEARHAKNTELHARARDLDPDVAADHRLRYMAAIAVAMLMLAMVVSWSASQGGGNGYRVAIWGSGNAALLTLMTMVLFRQRLFASAYNRRSMFLVILASTGIFLSRVLMQRLDVPVTHALVADLVLLAGIAGAAGITMAPWLLWLSGLSASAAIAAALFPAWIPIIVVGTALASTGVMAWFLWGAKRLNP